MYRSILLPVGSSDIDGPDLIVIGWNAEVAKQYKGRMEAARGLADEYGESMTCVRFRDGDALAFMTPDEDELWLDRLEEMHAGNSLLAVEEAPEYFEERWGAKRVPMPDPARVSFYPEGDVFYSGPIGLSALRWETSCGISIEESGLVSPARKKAMSR